MFTLKLSTEEIKTLQLMLESHLVNVQPEDYLARELLEKVTLVQLNPNEEPKKDTGRVSFQCVPIF